MLNANQEDVVSGVVESIAVDIQLQEEKYRQRAEMLAAAEDQRRQKAERRQKRFDEIIAQIETGFHNVIQVSQDAHLLQLFDSLKQVGRDFTLYHIASEHDGVRISLSSRGLFLSINSRRVSCVQNYRGPTSYSECTWSRWCGFTSHAPSIKFTFQNLLLYGFEDEWFDWLHPEKPSTFNVLFDEVHGSKHLHPEDFAFKRFFRFDSLTLKAQVTAAYEEAEKLEAEGYDVDGTLHALYLNPGLVLGRFFFDCADAKKLQQHLARAIAAL